MHVLETAKKHIILIAVIGAMLAQGAFFAPFLVVLNIAFLSWLFICAKPLRFDMTAIFLYALALLGLLYVVFSDVRGAAIEELLKYLLFPLSYTVFSNMDDSETAASAFYHAIILLAAAGLLAVVGFSVMPDMVIYETGRLQSFLQYANTTALLLSAGVLMAADNFLVSRRKRHLFYGIIMLGAFLLTESRIGFWIFVPVALLYVIAHIPKKAGLFCLLALAAAMAGFLAAGSRFMQISIFEATLVERFISYHDAIAALIANPMGIGLGMWQFEHLQLQTAPYRIMYIHNVYLQIALDTGVLGLLLFLAAMGLRLLRIRNFRSVYVFILMLIAGGSILEVNFAFGIVIILYTFVLSRNGAERQAHAEERRFNISAAKLRLVLALPAAALLCLLVSDAAVFAGRVSGYSGEPVRAMRAFEVAHTFNPFSNRIFAEKARVQDNPRDALRYLLMGHESNPLDGMYVSELIIGYRLVNEPARELEFARRLFELNRFSPAAQSAYSEALSGNYRAGLITQAEYEYKLASFRERAAREHANINPLFRHVDPTWPW